MAVLPFLINAQRSEVSIKEFNIESKGKSYEIEELKKVYSPIVKLDNELNYSKATIDSFLLNGVKDSYIGPIQVNGQKYVYLIKDVISTYKMRAGQILIDPINTSESGVDSIAKEILVKLKNGSSFDEMCKKYSYSDNSKHECDLGWFMSGEMVKMFEQAVLEHKKGDIFRVKSEFGTHIVKILEDSIEQSRVVTFLEIKLN